MSWMQQDAKPLDQLSLSGAKQHQSLLTKPPGSLGRLETLAEQFAAWQGQTRPQLEAITVVIFAADHGICQKHISAFPQEVTSQMIINFLEGGAAISVLSRQLGASFHVCNLGTVAPLPDSYAQHPQLIQKIVAPQTADFSEQEAMTQGQLEQALAIGRDIAASLETDLFIGGEMGIGNTSAASAIYSALLSLEPEAWVGKGTGIDDEGLLRKQQVIEQALSLHPSREPLDVLRCFGGFEIAALVGCYIHCAQRGIPVLVDGFICSAAALLAQRINPTVGSWLLFSHCSGEQAHHKVLQSLGVEPLLDLGLRLGEGSGAALAVPLIQSALNLHNLMATFDQAGVSDG